MPTCQRGNVLWVPQIESALPVNSPASILEPNHCMQATMSFHYPSSSHSSAAMDMSHSAYMSSYPPSTNSMMEVRPLQQPPVPPAPSIPTQIPAQHPAPLLPPPPSVYPSPASHHPVAKRRESLSKALKLRRSHSTPNVRPQGMNEADADSLGLSGEKKRNRLGYARTNMACGRSYLAILGWDGISNTK